MARQRGDDQHHRLDLELFKGAHVVGKPLETAQLAEGFVDLDAFADRHTHTVHVHRVDAKHGFFVIFAQTVDQVVTGRQTLRELVLPQWRQRVTVHLGSGLGEVSKGFHHGTLGFVELVEHGVGSGR